MATTQVQPATRIAPVANRGESFRSFLPTNIRTARDGGSIVVDGQLSRSTNAQIRFDGSFASPTRGQIFVKTSVFGPGAAPTAERPMTKVELQDLSRAIKNYISQNPDGSLYSGFSARIDEAIASSSSSTSTVDLSKIRTTIYGPNSSASVAATITKNNFPGPGSTNTVTLGLEMLGQLFDGGEVINRRDNAPRYGISKVEVYERGTNKLVATGSAPRETGSSKTGTNTYSRNFSLSIPGSNIDSSKQYAVVVTTTVNGSQPQKVRSAFQSVSETF
jgi:hypothetical protein